MERSFHPLGLPVLWALDELHRFDDAGPWRICYGDGSDWDEHYRCLFPYREFALQSSSFLFETLADFDPSISSLSRSLSRSLSTSSSVSLFVCFTLFAILNSLSLYLTHLLEPTYLHPKSHSLLRLSLSPLACSFLNFSLLSTFSFDPSPCSFSFRNSPSPFRYVLVVLALFLKFWTTITYTSTLDVDP